MEPWRSLKIKALNLMAEKPISQELQSKMHHHQRLLRMSSPLMAEKSMSQEPRSQVHNHQRLLRMSSPLMAEKPMPQELQYEVHNHQRLLRMSNPLMADKTTPNKPWPQVYHPQPLAPAYVPHVETISTSQKPLHQAHNHCFLVARSSMKSSLLALTYHQRSEEVSPFSIYLGTTPPKKQGTRGTQITTHTSWFSSRRLSST